MKSVFLVLMIIFTAFAAAQAAPKAHILSFKVWKQKKVDEAKSIVAEFSRQMKKVNNAKTADEEEDRDELTRKLGQAELNLGVAKELSANDYFVLYVAPQFKDNTEALEQAAKTLSSKDVADILNAYEKRLQTTNEVYGAKASVPGLDPSAL